MEENKKNQWQKEYESFPEWLKKFINLFKQHCGTTYDWKDGLCCGCPERIKNNCNLGDARIIYIFPFRIGADMAASFDDLSEFCKALSAPTEHEEGKQISSFNVVELAAFCEEDEVAWDAPCRYGHRVIGHAVYCHCPWPDRPRKCRRKWEGKEYRFEDCPGFAPNNSFTNYEEAGD